jgi:hypothetical protein
MSKFLKGTSAISLTPHISDFIISDFIGPIKTPDVKSFHALRDPSNVDGQGIIEWQIKDILGSIGTIRTHGYFFKSAPVRLFSPQTYSKRTKKDRCMSIINGPK